MADRETMTAQQRVQLKHVAKYLHSKFQGMFGLETVERLSSRVTTSWPKTATVTRWLVVGAEKYALQRLEALAHSQDQSGKKFRPFCFSAYTTPGAPRWPWAGSIILLPAVRSLGRAVRSRDLSSIRMS